MATIADVVRVIESFAPVEIQENWDNCGLCAGSPDAELTGVLVGFDCTRALIDEAVECGANMVVTHHPLIFHGLKKVDEADPVGDALIRAIRAGVAILCPYFRRQGSWRGELGHSREARTGECVGAGLRCGGELGRFQLRAGHHRGFPGSSFIRQGH